MFVHEDDADGDCDDEEEDPDDNPDDGAHVGLVLPLLFRLWMGRSTTLVGSFSGPTELMSELSLPQPFRATFALLANLPPNVVAHPCIGS